MLNRKWVLTAALVLSSLAQAQGPVSSGKITIDVLTDPARRTLYVFDIDKPNDSKCEGPCLAAWPPLLADGAESPTDPDLGIFMRKDGRKQFAHKGRPLYFFGEDKAPGDALGSELHGVWHVIPIPAPPAPVFQVVAGCQEADYIEANADRIPIGVSGRSYNPRCIRIKAGAFVTIAASGMHPLQAMATNQGVANPFAGPDSGHQAPVMRKLTEPGFYGYFCLNHGTADGEGMAGAIQVVR